MGRSGTTQQTANIVWICIFKLFPLYNELYNVNIRAQFQSTVCTLGGANEQSDGPASPSGMYYPQEGYADPEMMSEDQLVPQEPEETQPPVENVVRLIAVCRPHKYMCSYRLSRRSQRKSPVTPTLTRWYLQGNPLNRRL